MSKTLSITPETTLAQLIDMGLVTSTQINKWNNKIERDTKRQVKKAQISGIKDVITNLIGSELFAESKYWSVRQSNNSKGFIDYMDGVERHHVLEALSQLVDDGVLKKIGLKKDADGKYQELDPSTVNAFQIRYIKAQSLMLGTRGDILTPAHNIPVNQQHLSYNINTYKENL